MPVHDLFATPIFVKDFEGETLAQIQDQIKGKITLIDAAMKEAPWGGATRSTWTPGHCHAIENLGLEKMALGIIDAGVEYLGQIGYDGPDLRMASSWFNWISKGGFQFDHVHPGTRISGVYYYQTNEEDGDLRFTSPLPHMQMGMWPYDSMIMPEQHITPKVGRMVLWPSWLSHRVEPNLTDHDRISLSFTLK